VSHADADADEWHGRAFLGRRSQGRQASGATGSTPSTTERRERSLVQRAAAGAGGARLCPAGADAGEGRA